MENDSFFNRFSDFSFFLIKGFFGPRVPVDNLDGGTVGVSYFGDMDLVNPVVVSPDAGGVYR
jgi:ribose-phosphate pyrophosphokinase